LRNKRPAAAVPTAEDCDDDDLINDLLSPEVLEARNAMLSKLAQSSGKKAGSDNSGAAAASSSSRNNMTGAAVASSSRNDLASSNEDDEVDDDENDGSEDEDCFTMYDPDQKNPVISSSLPKGTKPSNAFAYTYLYFYISYMLVFLMKCFHHFFCRACVADVRSSEMGLGR